jgi:hypothetical protein
MSTPETQEVPGVNVLLLGSSGCGKTTAIQTLLDAGLEVFVLFTEPGMEVLAHTDPERLHWNYVKPASPSFSDIADSAKKINTLTYELLSKLPGVNKTKYGNFIEMVNCMADFHCQRTGKNYGCVEDWGSDKAFVIDSLSGLSIAALNLVVGSKPVKAQGEWGVAMDNLERLIIKLCMDTQCVFVMTAHLERETDEISQGTMLMPSTLGKKLSPKIGRFFSDVVHVIRRVDKFHWSTISNNVELKARNLPLKDDLPPTFVPIIKKWRATQTEPLTK